jgi:Ni/Co efflux regulator RcnB
MPPKQGQQPPPPPPAGDEEEECVSNKEVRTMMKAKTELFTKNQQSTDMTLE